MKTVTIVKISATPINKGYEISDIDTKIIETKLQMDYFKKLRGELQDKTEEKAFKFIDPKYQESVRNILYQQDTF
jgi:hypothetical protein